MSGDFASRASRREVGHIRAGRVARRRLPSFERLEERRLFSTAYALLGTAGTVLARFDTSTPETIDASVAVTGLGRTERLAGIDFRPATGQLYALGITSTAGDDEGRVYTINRNTGAATQVGSTPFKTDLVPGSSYGFDFNPAVDRIRIFNDADQNFRVNPNNGTLAGLDTNLDNPTNDEEVTGGAYDRNINDIMPAGQPAAKTTLFGIDFINDTLVRIGGVDGGAPEGSPNGGIVTEIGPLGLTTATASNGFDIGQDGTALAILTNQDDDNATGLYSIDLTTGEATLVGDLNNAAEIVRGFAVQPDNFPPIANPDTYQVGAGGTLNVPAPGVLANDTDPEGDGLTAELINQVSNGMLLFNSDGSFQYTPNPGFIGVDSFNYVANDGTSDSGPATLVTINVVPLFTINDVALTEGNSGTKIMTFTVSLSAPAGAGGATVQFQTKNNTAGSGDYDPTSGLVVFAPGQTQQPINVTIKGDTKVEPDETFFVKLSNPTGGAFGDDTGVGTILSDDGVPPQPQPQPNVFISLNDESLPEGNSGTRVITFKVWLDKSSTKQVKVNFATQNGTAGSGDYNTKSGVITFNAGETQKTISVTIKGDTKVEANETFFVNLSNAINASISKSKGTGVIVNDD